MFKTKKSKIKTYLNVKEEMFTPFDHLLSDYLSGELKNRLDGLGLQRLSIYIDWLPDYKCINIQGRYQKNYVDIQIEPSSFSIGCDPVEPDDHTEFVLEDLEQFYTAIRATISAGPSREGLVISYEQLAAIFSFDTQKRHCLEIEFWLKGNEKFDCCCMGKAYSKASDSDTFWFGLTPDGQYASEYSSFEDFAEAIVFDGKRLKDVWSDLRITSIDGCDPRERFTELFYNR